MNKQDLKEKALVIGVTTAAFLPARLVFYTYVSQYWLSSFGLISAIAVIMYILVTKNKLGRFGEIYRKQIAKMVRGKAAKFIIVISVVCLVYFGSSPFLLERANTLYVEEKEFYLQLLKLLLNNVVTGKSEKFNEKIPFEKFANERSIIQNIEKSFSIAIGISDDITNGWILHFYTVGFVGELEVLTLLGFYRFAYKTK